MLSKHISQRYYKDSFIEDTWINVQREKKNLDPFLSFPKNTFSKKFLKIFIILRKKFLYIGQQINNHICRYAIVVYIYHIILLIAFKFILKKFQKFEKIRKTKILSKYISQRYYNDIFKEDIYYYKLSTYKIIYLIYVIQCIKNFFLRL